MAMINCPECGKEISDKAKTCIHCGCPIESTNEVVQYMNTSSAQKRIISSIKIAVMSLLCSFAVAFLIHNRVEYPFYYIPFILSFFVLVSVLITYFIKTKAKKAFGIVSLVLSVVTIISYILIAFFASEVGYDLIVFFVFLIPVGLTIASGVMSLVGSVSYFVKK